MTRTAILYGAGASRAFGYPLTSELLPRILEGIQEDRLFKGVNSPESNLADRNWLKSRLFAFIPGIEDAWKAGSNELGIGITDILTLADRALLVGEARAQMSPEEIVRFRQLLERALYEVLLHNNDRRKETSRKQLDSFAAWLRTLDGTVGLVTTNYDFAVDSRIFAEVSRDDPDKWSERVATDVDFGFEWRKVDTGELKKRPSQPRWELFKLHGSVNWLRCNLCGQTYLNSHGATASKAFSNHLNRWNTCHCNNWLRLRMHLVTPSFIRQTHDAQLLGIWQAALELFRTADRWIIIGYSLPSDDISVRSLLLRAWDGRGGKPEITVVQRDNPATERVYRTFFPARNLTYLTGGLEAFLDTQLGTRPSQTASRT